MPTFHRLTNARVNGTLNHQDAFLHISNSFSFRIHRLRSCLVSFSFLVCYINLLRYYDAIPLQTMVRLQNLLELNFLSLIFIKIFFECFFYQ